MVEDLIGLLVQLSRAVAGTHGRTVMHSPVGGGTVVTASLPASREHVGIA